MNFQNLVIVETPAVYLDHALKAARKKALEFRRQLRKRSPEDRKRRSDQELFKVFADALATALLRIPERFPNLDALPEFYLCLIETTLDVHALKGALASISTAAKNIRILGRDFQRQLARSQDLKASLAAKRQGIGRISSVVKRLGKDLRLLETARKTMRTYPSVKTGLFTVAIAGFPNVGKSTLLSRLTPARPEIKDYAFTTKTLNIGYLTYRHNKLQFIDTPGTLNRPERMNDVERQASLAMKYVANLIVYVYDPSESYPLADQEALELLVREYGQEVILYLSKTDLVVPERLSQFERSKPGIITSVEALREKVTAIFEKEFLGTR